MMRHVSLWALAEEFLLRGQLGGAGPCMRMVGSFTVRRSPAPGHGCILQSPLGRNLKHYLRCTSTNDTRHHPTPTLYLHTFLFFYSHWRFWSTGQQRNSRKQQGGHTFTWFRHFAHIGFHSKVMFRNFCTSTRFRYTFYFRYHKLWFTSFSQMRNYWHTQKMPYFVQTSWTSLKTSQQRSLGSDRVKMKITSLPYFRVKLSCVCLMFAYRKK